MKKVKSAPADLCLYCHRKKENSITTNKAITNKAITNNIISNSIDLPNNKKVIISFINFGKNNENNENNENDIIKKQNFNKNIILEKKKKSTIYTALVTDTYFEFAKKLPILDNYYYNGLVDIINNFISNKLNRQNLENLLTSIIIRLIFSTICHDILMMVREINEISN